MEFGRYLERKRREAQREDDQGYDYLDENDGDQGDSDQEEDCDESVADSIPPQPKKPQKLISALRIAAEEDREEVEIDVPKRPTRRTILNKSPIPSKPEEVKRIGLSADIRRDLHIRLKIHAIRQGKSIVKVIEEWIEANCPE